MTLLSSTAPLRSALAQALSERPFALRFWDGSEIAATEPGGPTITVRSPTAIAHLLRAPGQLGLGRAYVSGALEVDDLDGLLGLLEGFSAPKLDRAQRARLALAAVRACGLCLPPRVPESELRPRGRRHSRERDLRAVRHHYDISNELFALFLDRSMTYSCAIFSRGARTLEEAQEAKLDLICRKLDLREGERMLDVGCGWGSMLLHAARNYGVRALGITASPAQARLAAERVRAAGLAEQIEVRLADYRDLAGERFDAISSIGMVEHVGAVQIDDYAARLQALLRPGGRLLNHGIARLRHGDPEAGPFSERYVFPDAAPLHLSRILSALERAGLIVRHVEGFAEDYATTLAHWAERLEQSRERAVAIAGAERIRVLRLYLRVARAGFRSGFLSVYQVLCAAPPSAQASVDFDHPPIPLPLS
ncbi:MAG TPA: cyclopropane-fatty-acyl-phospholipid synthase family protein [Solirubrobacteraceae bacterium]|nr:cyclopropane-fatty-acyl-phospholipid synthase family protein [Solirubrobacteraceae bacterium]